jgi:serine/threonine-protein kinase
MAASERSELKGTVLDGRYSIGPTLGIGGTGVVFDARRLADGERVVVKTMRPVYALNADLNRRLRREAEVAATVAHAGIVPVLDEGTLEDGSPYVVFTRLHGESLARLLLREGALRVPEVAAITARVASILQAVHARGYVHRDVKPEHVILDRTPEGRLAVSLIDFGVCAAETAPSDERERERGRVYGTPSYVSPEQAAGNPDVDPRADVFALGIVMFECLAGRVPFASSNVSSLLRRIIREDAPRVGLVAPEVDRTTDEIVSRALAREPERRYASVRALARALGPLVGDRALVETDIAARLRATGVRAPSKETLRDDVAA